jgi:hypothetical protein
LPFAIVVTTPPSIPPVSRTVVKPASSVAPAVAKMSAAISAALIRNENCGRIGLDRPKWT